MVIFVSGKWLAGAYDDDDVAQHGARSPLPDGAHTGQLIRHCIHLQLDPANSISVISNSPFIFRTKSHFTWTRPSVIYYGLYRTPDISNYFLLPLTVRNSGVQLYDLTTKTLKTQAACTVLRWNKWKKVECIQMRKLTYGFAVICIT